MSPIKNWILAAGNSSAKEKLKPRPCDLCNAEVGEDLEHVFFDCPVYDKSV
jgi:hypothetical protein